MWSILPAKLKSDSSKSKLFPLKLATFERYMLADDQTDYPMAFAIILDVTGDLCREPFEAALRSALDRHPLLSCLVRRVPFRGLFWVQDRDVSHKLDWQENGDHPDWPESPRIDLFQEPGLRVWVRKELHGSRVIFQFHHAATDGLGAMQFIGDLLALYGMSTVQEGQEAPELELIDPQLLRVRESAGKVARGWRLFLLAKAELFKLVSHFPFPVALPKPDTSRGSAKLPFPAFVRRTFPRAVHRRIKELAAQKSVTPNDLLVAAMFQTIREWNATHDSRAGQEPLTIAVPVSLRTPQHDQMSAANVVSFMFLNEKGGAPKSADLLVQSIHRRTEGYASRSAAEGVMQLIRYGVWLPGLLEGSLKYCPCLASVTLANVGDVRRQFRAHFPLRQGKVVAGNIQLEALVGAAPVRRNSRVSVSLGVYAGTLYVNMHCDPRCFTNSQAEALADLFASQIYATALFPGENRVASGDSEPLEAAA